MFDTMSKSIEDSRLNIELGMKEMVSRATKSSKVVSISELAPSETAV